MPTAASSKNKKIQRADKNSEKNHDDDQQGSMQSDRLHIFGDPIRFAGGAVQQTSFPQDVVIFQKTLFKILRRITGQYLNLSPSILMIRLIIGRNILENNFSLTENQYLQQSLERQEIMTKRIFVAH